ERQGSIPKLWCSDENVSSGHTHLKGFQENDTVRCATVRQRKGCESEKSMKRKSAKLAAQISTGRAQVWNNFRCQVSGVGAGPGSQNLGLRFWFLEATWLCAIVSAFSDCFLLFWLGWFRWLSHRKANRKVPWPRKSSICAVGLCWMASLNGGARTL